MDNSRHAVPDWLEAQEAVPEEEAACQVAVGREQKNR